MTCKELSNAVVKALYDKKQKVSTAESCTGGLLSAYITSNSGSSNVFEYGIIAYANCVKKEELGVLANSLDKFGAVSEAVALEMAKGVRKKAGSDFGVAVTGVAGPLGGTTQKPVGTVYIAVDAESGVACELLSLGEECEYDREKIREETVRRALIMLKNKIASA